MKKQLEAGLKVGRLDLPNLSDDEQASVDRYRKQVDDQAKHDEAMERIKDAFLDALFVKGRPYLGKRKPRRGPSANKAYRLKMQERSRLVAAK